MTRIVDLELASQGGIYQVRTKAKDIGEKTRGVIFKEKAAGASSASEFFEEKAVVRTGK